MKLYSLGMVFLALSVSATAQTINADTVTYPIAASVKEDFKDDWAALSHYKKENALLAPAKAGEDRVVFLGSSIFEFWKDKMPEFFEGKPYVDRGISGQISPQLLIRFRQDVIDLHPKAVIILAGSNDISGSTGHVTNKTILDNIASMAELAQLHHIKVILCEYLPVNEYPWRKGLKPATKIIALNKEIRAYALANYFTVLDYFSPLVDEHNGQRAALTTDGVHPNKEGYKIMAKVTEAAIQKALHP
jgi:lysophospholipase L1-like esterase